MKAKTSLKRRDLGGKSRSVMAKTYKSFCITVRPRLGLKEPLKAELTKWFKRLPHVSAVTEKTGEAMHLHAQIWSDEGWVKGNIEKHLRVICGRSIEDWDKDQMRKCFEVKIATNAWMESYCWRNVEKDGIPDEEPVEFFDTGVTNPDDEGWYPSEDEQDKAKAKAHAKDKLMHGYLELWEERCEGQQVDRKNVAQFLSDVWYKWKLKPTVGDTKRRFEFVKNLLYYIRGYGDLQELMGQDEYNLWVAIQEEHKKREMENG